MPAGVINVGVMADFLSVIEQSDQAGLSVEAFSGKVVTSTRDASRAWADYAKSTKLSADVAASAAAKVAAAADAAFGSLDATAKAQGTAAMQAARATGASADEQSAAYAKAATAARDAQVIQKAAADSQVANSERAAAATKAMADAQAEAAAKVDLLSGHLSSLGEHTAGVAKEISKLGGVGFAASIAGMGDLAAKYQQATESIAANSGTSSAAAAKIGTAFLGTSGKTIYSAKDLTTSFATVAGQLKSTEGAALNAGQALKVMNAAGDLAEATNTDLTSSTGALSMVMQGYHLSVGQAAQASDLLFNTSRALNQPLGTVAQAITKLHGRLGDLAPSLGDVGGLMVELGSHGVQGSRGVTVVNTAFQTMISQSEPVQRMLGALDVTLFNTTTGKFVGMASAIKQLQPAFAGLTQQSQDLAAKTLFGAPAAQVMLATIQRGPEAFAKSTTAAAQLGTAHAAATDQSKTLGKQLDILKASVENDATSIGLKLLPSLIAMTHGLEDGVTWLEKHKTACEALGITIGTVLGGAVTVFAYQKSKAFVSGLSDMAHGATSLASGVGNAYSSIANSLGGITTDSAATTTAVDGSNATMVTSNATTGASFTTVATDGATAGATLDSEWAAAGTKVIATDDAIKTANVETASSFDAILTKLGPLTVAFAAYEAIKATPGIGNILGDGKGPKNSLPMPKTGETERSYLSQNLGLPGYKGPLTAAGVIHARTQEGYPAEKSMIDTVFKDLDSAGHFGKHGFAPSAQGSGLPIPGVKGSATTANPAQLVNYMQKALGLTKNQAAGIAGNIEEESAGSFAGNIVQGGGRSSTIVPNTGYGLAQWTDSGRQGNLAALAKQMGLPQDSVKVQEAFIVQELKGSYSNALKNLKGTSTAAQAATVIQNEYEGPASLTASLAERQQYAEALAGGKTVTPTGGGGSTAGKTGSGSLNAAIQNIGTGGTLPSVLQTSSATSQATQLSDQANRAQAVGQATVTWLQAINQQLQDKGAAVVQQLTNVQARATDHSAALVTAMKDSTQKSTDKATEQVTAMKAQEAISAQQSAIQVAKLTEATTAINDASAINVATINAAATKVSDADNAAATLTTDNAQTNADTISEKGLYGLNLVTQQLTVQEDILKAGFDQQIATAQAALDVDQGHANTDAAAAQQTTDLVTAQQTMLELASQQKVNTVTQTQDALEAKAQQHLDSVTLSQDTKEAKAQYHMDSVTLKEDAIANAAKAHVDAVTVSQDARILKATQHADNVQLSVDVTKIGPAQTWADMQAGASKTAQTQAQNALNLATAQGSVTTNAANAALATVTASANTSIAQAQNQYQTEQNAANTAIQVATDQYQQSQNAANMAIQTATGQYQAAQNKANSAIQTATDNYQAVQDTANAAIANAAQTQATIASRWATQLASDESILSGLQGQAATGEATASGAVSTESALSSTQFAGSGLTINQYGVDLSNPASMTEAASWAIRTSSVATG
jgi:hypothetical protein